MPNQPRPRPKSSTSGAGRGRPRTVKSPVVPPPTSPGPASRTRRGSVAVPPANSMHGPTSAAAPQPAPAAAAAVVATTAASTASKMAASPAAAPIPATAPVSAPALASPSSTPSSGEASERSTNQINFQVLNYNHPADARAVPGRPAASSNASRVVNTVESNTARQQSVPATRKSNSRAETPTTRQSPRPASRPVSSPSDDSDTRMSSSASPAPPPVPPVDTHSENTTSSRTAPHSASPTQFRGPAVRCHPLEIYPESWHPSVRNVIRHYMTHIAVPNPDLDGPYRHNLLQTVWFPFMFTDTTLLHSFMLLAGSYCSADNGIDSHSFDIYAFRGLAISGINEQIMDPEKGVRDEIVGAVLNIAAYEALFGELDAFQTHMGGLQQIVQIRGGLGSLGLDGLLEKLILWVDANAAYLTGNEIYFDRRHFPSSFSHPVPDTARFGSRRDLAIGVD